MASRSFFVSRRSGDSPLDLSPEPKLSPRGPLRRRTCQQVGCTPSAPTREPSGLRRERDDPQRDGQPSGGLFSPPPKLSARVRAARRQARAGNRMACVHTGRDFRLEPRWTTGSECVYPRSRTPERTRLATCPQKRIRAPAVGDRPQHRTATLPPWFVRSSSLSSSLLATANWANATYSASKAIRDCSCGEFAATVHVLIHIEWNRGTWPPSRGGRRPPSTCPVYRTLRNAARKCPSRGSPSESARAVLMVASSVAMASTSWRAPVGRLP
jgi:hypothetical protein